MPKSNKSRRSAARKKPRGKSKTSSRAVATWHGLFGRAESLVRGEPTFRAVARTGAAAVAAEAVTAPNEVDALVGIWWTDPTFPIFYDIIINNTPVPPPNSSRTGEVVRTVTLRRGQPNVVAWTVQHMGQGWKHRVYLKFDDQVIPLESAEDPSDGDSDDLTSGSQIVNVPA